MKKPVLFCLVIAILLSLSVPAFAAQEPAIPAIVTESGASVRMKADSGLRFVSTVNRAEFDALISAYGKEHVTVGTLIAPAAYVKEAGSFTKAALDALSKSSAKYLDVIAKTPFEVTDTDYLFAGSVTNILDHHYNLPFAAIGYIAVNRSIRYSDTYSVRTVSEVATAAYADVSTVPTEEYTEAVRDGLYSPYTAAERAILNSLRDPSVYEISSVAQWKVFTSLVNNDLDRFAGKSVVLTADLDFSEAADYTPVGNNPDKGDTSIIQWGDTYDLTGAVYFAGTLDGQGHRIRGIKAAFTHGHTGLFGVTCGATVKNLAVEASFSNTSAAWNNGILIGLAINTVVDRCRIGGSYASTTAGLVGGVIGTAGGVVSVSNTICNADCGSMGNQYAGGFVGYAFGGADFTCVSLRSCYLLTPDVKNQNGFISALIGHGGGTKYLANCYVAYTGAGSTQKLTDGGNDTVLQSAVITAEELKSKAPVLGSAFAAVEDGAPVLSFEAVPSVLEITSVDDWINFTNAVNGGNTYRGTVVRLTCDLDLSSVRFVPVGNNAGKGDNAFITWSNTYDVSKASYFAGVFDGQGHRISGLNAAFDQGYTGLFGMTYGAKICNLSLDAVFTNQSGAWHNGLLIGLAINTEIDSCYVSGKYDSRTAGLVGGMVGTAANSLVIRNSICAADCSALGNQYSGGIVGYAFGAQDFTVVSMTNCYLRTAKVANQSGAAIRLLIGDGSGSKLIDNCYAVCTDGGNVIELAGGAKLLNGSGLITDAELKTMTDRLGNAFRVGTSGYPVLSWME